MNTYVLKTVLMMIVSVCFLAIMPSGADAKTCYLKYGEGKTAGHLTERGATIAAWRAWQNDVRNKHNRRFSYALSYTFNGFPQTWKDGRRWKGRVLAYPCTLEGNICISGNGQKTCGCHTYPEEAKNAGCSTFHP